MAEKFFVFGMEPHHDLRIPYYHFFNKSLPEHCRPEVPQLEEILSEAITEFAAQHPEFAGNVLHDGRTYGFRKQENVTAVEVYNAKIFDIKDEELEPLDVPTELEEVGKLLIKANPPELWMTGNMNSFDVEVVSNAKFNRDNFAWNGELLACLAQHAVERLGFCDAERMRQLFTNFAQTVFPTMWKLQEHDLRLFEEVRNMFAPRTIPDFIFNENRDRFLFITTSNNASTVLEFRSTMLSVLGPGVFKAEWVLKEVGEEDTFLHTLVMGKVFSAIQHSFNVFKRQRQLQLKVAETVNIRRILSDEQIAEANNAIRVSGGIMLRCYDQFVSLLVPSLRERLAPLVAEVRNEHGKLRTDA